MQNKYLYSTRAVFTLDVQDQLMERAILWACSVAACLVWVVGRAIDACLAPGAYTRLDLPWLKAANVSSLLFYLFL